MGRSSKKKRSTSAWTAPATQRATLSPEQQAEVISTFLGALQDGDEEHKVELFEITLTPMKNREVFDAEEYESKFFGICTPEFCNGNYGYDKFERADVEENVRLELEHAYAVVKDDARSQAQKIRRGDGDDDEPELVQADVEDHARSHAHEITHCDGFIDELVQPGVKDGAHAQALEISRGGGYNDELFHSDAKDGVRMHAQEITRGDGYNDELSLPDVKDGVRAHWADIEDDESPRDGHSDELFQPDVEDGGCAQAQEGSLGAGYSDFKRLLAMGHEARQAKLQREHMERIAAYEDSTGLKYEEPDEEDNPPEQESIPLDWETEQAIRAKVRARLAADFEAVMSSVCDASAERQAAEMWCPRPD